MELDQDTEPRQFPKVSAIQLDRDTQPVILSVKTGRKDLRATQLAEARKVSHIKSNCDTEKRDAL